MTMICLDEALRRTRDPPFLQGQYPRPIPLASVLAAGAPCNRWRQLSFLTRQVTRPMTALAPDPEDHDVGRTA